MISNELFQFMCSLDENITEEIASNLRLRTKNIYVTGYLLGDARAIGYTKGIYMINKLLTCNKSSKQSILKEINSIDLSNYFHNSSKSCWNNGFKQAISHFTIEVENCVGKTRD